MASLPRFCVVGDEAVALLSVATLSSLGVEFILPKFKQVLFQASVSALRRAVLLSNIFPGDLPTYASVSRDRLPA